MALTLKQARKALNDYRNALPVAYIRGLRRGLRNAERLAKTKYMRRKRFFPQNPSRGQREDPANPPPGPLGIRSANLVRTLKIVVPKKVGRYSVRGGLRAGSSDVPYAAIHEDPQKRGRNFTGRVWIPARPYMRPALDDPAAKVEEEVEKEVQKLTLSALRGLIVPRAAGG
jgi:hypothetical protein